MAESCFVANHAAIHEGETCNTRDEVGTTAESPSRPVLSNKPRLGVEAVAEIADHTSDVSC